MRHSEHRLTADPTSQSTDLDDANDDTSARWSAWRLAAERVHSRRVVLPTVDALRLYRVRVVLHADEQSIGSASAPFLVDAHREPLLNTPRWPATRLSSVSDSARDAYAPTVLPIDSGSFAVAVPPISPCRRDTVRWVLLWRRDGAPADDDAHAAAPGASPLGPWRQPMPIEGRILLVPWTAPATAHSPLIPGTTYLVAKALRCPRGCTFRLLPHNIDGWSTPSASTTPVRSPLLAEHAPDNEPSDSRPDGDKQSHRPGRLQLEVRLRVPSHGSVEPSTAPVAADDAACVRFLDALNKRVVSDAPTAHDDDKGQLHVVECRFGEYAVLAATRGLEATVVRVLLTGLAAAKRQHATHAIGSEGRDVDERDDELISSMLEPSYGLVEVLADGTAVQRVVLGDDGGGGWGAAIVACVGTLVAAALVAAVRHVWNRGGRAYDTVTASGAEAVVAAADDEAHDHDEEEEGEVVEYDEDAA
jgi:hypothetical protein